tara:strand:+ start:1302 stop:1754 length:453 start_codon:yes stop_codon:yes gene_type:complete
MLKKISLLLLLCSLWGCDYKPLYLKKNDLGKLIKITTLNGDSKINKTIVSFLRLKDNKNINSGYTLVLNSTKRIDVVSKDKSGNPSVYRSTVIVDLLLSDANTTIKQKEFNSSFTYNNSQNKFDLSQYQKNIEINLINEIAEKIFIFLKS